MMVTRRATVPGTKGVVNMDQSETGFRVAHIVEWQRCGQSCFAVLRGDAVISRHATMREAIAAYREVRHGRI